MTGGAGFTRWMRAEAEGVEVGEEVAGVVVAAESRQTRCYVEEGGRKKATLLALKRKPTKAVDFVV